MMVEVSYKTYCFYGAVRNPDLIRAGNRYFYLGEGILTWKPNV